MSLPLLAALLGLGAALLRPHLGIANDAGSPDSDSPFEIADSSLAQAIYGRLGPERPAEHYRFSAVAGTCMRAMLLIPERSYAAGLRAQFTIGGPGLPGGGATSVMRPHPLSIAGRNYILAQRYGPPLPESGTYTLVVRRLDGAGAYRLCLGQREGGRAQRTMRERIARLLDE
jgi:hypothetical protein